MRLEPGVAVAREQSILGAGVATFCAVCVWGGLPPRTRADDGEAVRSDSEAAHCALDEALAPREWVDGAAHEGRWPPSKGDEDVGS